MPKTPPDTASDDNEPSSPQELTAAEIPMRKKISPEDSTFATITSYTRLADENSPRLRHSQQPAQQIHPRNVSLPDIDDESMNKVFEYVEYYQQDLLWSFCSDLLFVLGGFAYVAVSIWDCLDPPTEDDDKEDVSYSYFLLSAAGPLIYVLNSLIDIQWARNVQKRGKIRRRMTQSWGQWRMCVGGTPVDAAAASKLASDKAPAVVDESWYQVLRKHAAHRRSILAATTFGMAALLEVAAFFAQYSAALEGTWAPRLDIFSTHMYIVSAIVSVSGKRNRPWLKTSSVTESVSIRYLFSNPETVEDMGDLLFLIGSVVDSILVDFRIEKPILGLMANTLWLVDAFLYLRSDYIAASDMESTSNVGNNVLV
jgi:hypothetical protein